MKRTKPLTCSLRELEALRAAGTKIFRCAHHWVSDESIAEAWRSGHFDDPRIPWTETTHRAARIAAIAKLMEEGARFPPLYAFAHTRRHRLHELALRDGHHRLRALQYLGRTDSICFKIGGNHALLQEMLFGRIQSAALAAPVTYLEALA